MACMLLFERIVRRSRMDSTGDSNCSVPLVSRLERYIADIPPDRFGRPGKAARLVG